ncbi:MAG: DNA/RNA non-specific endonuclease [Bacteroidaceae bacterium]|nr:DNA/RNA non-specific endonuclease [Bacteroidaceae bacterium]
MKPTTKARLIFAAAAIVIVAGISILVHATIGNATAQPIMTTAEAVEPALPTEPAELQAGKAKFDKHINPSPLIAAPVSGEVRLVRTGYTVSYNPRLRQPNYVAWTLTAPRTYGNNKREPQFYEDAQLDPSQRTLLNDYYNSGMSRGHMCPAADNKWNAQAMQESFILSNVCPQTYTLNGEDWEHLESFCRTFVRRNKTAIHIICGPIFTSNPPQLRRKRLYVPDQFFKAIVCLDKGAERGIAFVYNNDSEQHPMSHYVRTIDQVEQLTGLDLFSSIPAKIQDRIEARSDLRDWR